MHRKPIKAGQLLAILNQRLMRYPETVQCRIISVSPIKTTDREQCNWSSNVSWNANGQNRELAMPIIRRLVINAQKDFNLLPAGASAVS